MNLPGGSAKVPLRYIGLGEPSLITPIVRNISLTGHEASISSSTYAYTIASDCTLTPPDSSSAPHSLKYANQEFYEEIDASWSFTLASARIVGNQDYYTQMEDSVKASLVSQLKSQLVGKLILSSDDYAGDAYLYNYKSDGTTIDFETQSVIQFDTTDLGGHILRIDDVNSNGRQIYAYNNMTYKRTISNGTFYVGIGGQRNTGIRGVFADAEITSTSSGILIAEL